MAKRAAKKAQREIDDLLAWRPQPSDEQILKLSWKYQNRYMLSLWDGLILASVKAAGCGYLSSENFQAAQSLDGVRVVSPFLSQPQEV